ncbi:DUF922 domain-containing protein [Jiella sp. M17.18]|uniref:DUF922 domain-containing protein n=1 Tax=Jiella sp. M17.18 TaxID=3234247 RepID=UPI0034DEFDE1
MSGIVGVGLACVLACQAKAASIHQTTTYFAVHGATLADIDRDLGSQGPFVLDTGIRHPGATQVQFDGTVTYRHTAYGCEVDQPNLTLNLKIMLPHWTPPADVAPRTVVVWHVLEQDIRRHEETHAAIAKNWLKRLESVLRNLPEERTCATMKAAVGATTKRYLAAHEAAQQNFDRIEAGRVDARLHREVQAALQ